MTHTYTPVTWSDEVPQTNPVQFNIKDSNGNILYANCKIEVATTITTPGTPVNAANLNHIETGIQVAQNDANAKIDLGILAHQGSVINASSPGVAAELTIGNPGQVLTVVGNSPVWDTNIKLFATTQTNASWQGSSKTVQTYIFTANSFNANIPTNARALIMTISAKWAAAADASMINIHEPNTGGNGIVVRAVAANIFQDNTGIVGLDSGGNLNIQVANVGPTAVYLDCWGYIL